MMTPPTGADGEGHIILVMMGKIYLYSWDLVKGI